MNHPNPGLMPPRPAKGDVPAKRRCLRCKVTFSSDGFGERICKKCKAQVGWKSAVPTGDGGSRRHSSR